MGRTKPNGVVTPRMREALRNLCEGKLSGCGRPTRQRLVREGLAVYVDDPPKKEWETEWDRELEITTRGREVVREFGSKKRGDVRIGVR